MNENVQPNQFDYRINLDVFEGPLDLLLHLIKKNDLNIYDIPISFITKEYLTYIDTLEEMNIDIAGEFLLMAAELAQIKSKMLLPPDPTTQTEEEDDPRADLVRRLLEYQRYKNAAEDLSQRLLLNKDVFKQQNVPQVDGPAEVEVDANAYNLIEAFSKILARAPKDVYHEVTVDRVSVSARIFQIVEMMKEKRVMKLEELLPDPIVRYSVVITFLALLEMCKLRMIKVLQMDNFDTIYIENTIQNINDAEVLTLIDKDKLSF